MFILYMQNVNRKDSTMGLSCKHGCSHLIRRDHIYSDVLKLYEDFSKIVNEFPFRISFNDEHAVDGGVGYIACGFLPFTFPFL
jgi:hypothetical protein